MTNLIIRTFSKGKFTLNHKHFLNLTSKNIKFFSSLMDKITYTSTKADVDPRRFAVGMLIDNELHVNPIHGILHVKPSFPYLDKSDKTLKDSGVDAGTNILKFFGGGFSKWY